MRRRHARRRHALPLDSPAAGSVDCQRQSPRRPTRSARRSPACAAARPGKRHIGLLLKLRHVDHVKLLARERSQPANARMYRNMFQRPNGGGSRRTTGTSQKSGWAGQAGSQRTVTIVASTPRGRSSAARLANALSGPPTNGQNRRVTIAARSGFTGLRPP